MSDSQKLRARLAQEHAKKDTEVFKFFDVMSKDIGSSFRTEPSGKYDVVAQRVQLVAVFTFVDVVASYWYEYLNKTGTQKERFLRWSEAFCFIADNPQFSGDVTLLNSKSLYTIRSSLVHFFGLGEGVPIMIAPNRSTTAQMNAWRATLKTIGRVDIPLLSPKDIYNLFLEGAILMLSGWKTNVADAQTDEGKKWMHIEAIDRIHRKIMKEGAILVPIPEQK
jgi:hypothetical protein